MNYYERHLGDYAKDTAHLSMLEHGAYTLLLDRYYSTEQGIPADQVHRLTRARTREEKAAVDAVLSEFFTLEDGVWINGRAEELIASYRDEEPDRQAKRENATERQRRARERRKQLFDELRCHGIVPAWDTKTGDLEALLSRATGHAGNAPVTPPVTRDDTATQKPVAKHQTPVERTQRASRLPDDWTLTPELEAFCREKRPDLNPFETAERFRDFWHSKPGKDGTKLDWPATWRNWVRNEKPGHQGQSISIQNGQHRPADIFG